VTLRRLGLPIRRLQLQGRLAPTPTGLPPASPSQLVRTHLQFPGQPSGRSKPTTLGSSWAPAPVSEVPSLAFTLQTRVRLSLGRLATGNLTTLARASLPPQTGQSRAPFRGLRCSASTAGSPPTPGAVLPWTLASPRTRLALAGCPELVARVVLSTPPLAFVVLCAPSCLGARLNRVTLL
jgi:hypothetical protein